MLGFPPRKDPARPPHRAAPGSKPSTAGTCRR